MSFFQVHVLEHAVRPGHDVHRGDTVLLETNDAPQPPNLEFLDIDLFVHPAPQHHKPLFGEVEPRLEIDHAVARRLCFE